MNECKYWNLLFSQFYRLTSTNMLISSFIHISHQVWYKKYQSLIRSYKLWVVNIDVFEGNKVNKPSLTSTKQTFFQLTVSLRTIWREKTWNENPESIPKSGFINNISQSVHILVLISGSLTHRSEETPSLRDYGRTTRPTSSEIYESGAHADENVS